MPYCFRIRFVLGHSSAIQYPYTEWAISPAEEPQRVVLRPAGVQQLISEARELTLMGSGYPSDDEATKAGELWRSRLMLAFSGVNVAADFGDRAPRGGFVTDDLRNILVDALQPQVQILPDVHGLMTFECEPPPLLSRVEPVTLRVVSPHESLAKHLRLAAERNLQLDPDEQVAYDLYSASFFYESADARFISLMMAVETLIKLEPRPEASRAHVDALIDSTKKSGLSEAEIRSMTTVLQYLKDESIRQGGRRLASTLGARTYMGKSAESFFTHCYDLRSTLLHGIHPLPSREYVGLRAAQAEVFVSNLLARPLLDDEE